MRTRSNVYVMFYEDAVKKTIPQIQLLGKFLGQSVSDEQAERIAEKFSSIQNEYQPLKNEDITVPPFNASDIPQFHPAQVWQL